MTSNPVCWFEIYVQDMPRAQRFYETTLGVKLEILEVPGLGEPEMEMRVFPMKEESAGAMGALVRMAGCPSGGNSTVVYFSCADCAVEAGRVKAAGGQVIKEKFSIAPHGFIALALDTEGNMIGLHSII